MVQTICVATHAQTVNAGPFSGTQGARSSYFGFFAGGAATASSTDNSFFGHQSGIITQGTKNTGFGAKTLSSNTSGADNSALGFQALYSNTTGIGNAATGYQALYSNTSGFHNTANGYWALFFNTVGGDNTAIGTYAMTYNTRGQYNTATGKNSLYKNDSDANTANGYKALYSNTSGSRNTGIGFEALLSNESGFRNTAIGFEALHSNKEGHWNSATGAAALYSNTSGMENTATGYEASYLNSTGEYNTANGSNAVYHNVDGFYNSGFGAFAGPNSGSLSNTTALGYLATPLASNQVKIGNTYVTSIGGYAMWTSLSDGRFKRNIKDDVSGLDFVNKLRPISYEVDKIALNKFLNIPDSLAQHSVAKKAAVRETGFIAQEVEAIIKETGAVFSGVEAPQNEHDHYSIRYAAFVVPLVKAVQELSAKVDEQEKKSEEQQLEISALKEKLGVYEGNPNGDSNNNMRVALFQNTPNPFSSDTEIKMALPETTRQASLIIYNMEGKQLKNIQVNDRGNAAVKISGSEFSAGIYLYALIVDGRVVDTKRLILTK